MRITMTQPTCITEATGTITMTVVTVEVGGRVHYIGPPTLDGPGPRFGCSTHAGGGVGADAMTEEGPTNRGWT